MHPHNLVTLSTSPPLIGGSGRTDPPKNLNRELPNIEFFEPPEGYAQLVATGWDSYQEAFNLHLTQNLTEALEAAKIKAADMNDMDGEAVTVEMGGEILQVRPSGAKGGNKWVFGNDDLLFMIRSPSMEWCVSVRYLAAALWEYGLEKLRERAADFFRNIGCTPRNEDWRRVSRADFAFDFYCPEFRQEMTPEIMSAVICHSSTKKRGTTIVDAIGRANKIETLTIGARGGGLQTQIYDKLKEIDEASGKTWMIDLWIRNGWKPIDGEIRDVWRLEIRMGGEFLKDRNIRTYEELSKNLEKLLTEALFTRRLTKSDCNDSNRRRWLMHPLYTMAYRAAGGNSMLPLGRYVTGARMAIADKLTKQIAGTIRSKVILQYNEFSEEDVEEVFADVRKTLAEDRQARRKEEAAKERYKFVDEAK